MDRSPALALALTLTLACGDDKNGSADGSSTGQPGTTGSGTTDGPATGEPTTTVTSTGEPGTTSGTGDATDPTTGATSDGTTGELAYCHGWEGPDGEPHLELHNNGVPVTDGGELALECGGQGLYMFGLYPTFGGFTPANESLTFEVVVDVPGHNTDPSGHFYTNVSYGYYIGCEDLIGGVFGVVPIFPPDNEDPLMLDGLPAAVQVTMHAGDVPVTIDFDVTLSVDPNDPSFEFCGMG